jgi:hypothetical protein
MSGVRGSMNVTYACPHCEQAVRAEVVPQRPTLSCTHCGATTPAPPGAMDGGRLRRCLVCAGTDLFLRKDFPQRLGMGIVIVGFAASCVTWHLYLPAWTFAILFATVFVDIALYLMIGTAVMCYRCHAQYRCVENLDDFGHFNLETHERYRQQAIRLAEHGPRESVPR